MIRTSIYMKKALIETLIEAAENSFISQIKESESLRNRKSPGEINRQN